MKYLIHRILTRPFSTSLTVEGAGKQEKCLRNFQELQQLEHIWIDTRFICRRLLCNTNQSSKTSHSVSLTWHTLHESTILSLHQSTNTIQGDEESCLVIYRSQDAVWLLSHSFNLPSQLMLLSFFYGLLQYKGGRNCLYCNTIFNIWFEQS